MNDTDKKTKKLYREMFENLSGEKKLKMGFSMFEFGKKILLGNLKPRSDSPQGLKKSVFLRVYGNDFPKEKLKKILARFTRL